MSSVRRRGPTPAPPASPPHASTPASASASAPSTRREIAAHAARRRLVRAPLRPLSRRRRHAARAARAAARGAPARAARRLALDRGQRSARRRVSRRPARARRAGSSRSFVSDHLCWTAFGGHESHDLLPVAYTDEVLDHVAARVAQVQERLGRRAAPRERDAPTSRSRARSSDEAEFFAALCRRTGCGMLLDVNNLFVNAANLGSDPQRALAALPDERRRLPAPRGPRGARRRAHRHARRRGARRRSGSCSPRRSAASPRAGVIVERDDDLPTFDDARGGGRTQARARHARRARGSGVGSSAASRRSRARRQPTGPGATLQREFFARLVDKPARLRARGDLAGLLDDVAPGTRRARHARLQRRLRREPAPRARDELHGARARALAGGLRPRSRRPICARTRRTASTTCGSARASRRSCADFDFAGGLRRRRAARSPSSPRSSRRSSRCRTRPTPRARWRPPTLAAIAPEAWEEVRFAFAPRVPRRCAPRTTSRP